MHGKTKIKKKTDGLLENERSCKANGTVRGSCSARGLFLGVFTFWVWFLNTVNSHCIQCTVVFCEV